ncbi:Hybrid signal transduction histidine kinase [Phytophthora palmivora]|uniref:histidine kinase n=1 Tax=Phytophthora palmivora TaxID=4796 RepID=A0A2P4Y6S4_9STRA|nr:Hybrid signal transduction histidine kinase [Phytophthora palmivora]
MEISADPFQMQDLLEYSVEIFKFKAREKHIRLKLECSPKVPKNVIGDVSRLRQVLLNLLSNAIKFTNEVIDTGVGMDDEEKSRLFSLFTKLERTRKNNPTGSGLGLAICKQLVELMDGDIDVDSELGEGSEFFFTVVVRRLEDEEDDLVQKFPSVLAADVSAAPSLVSGNARHNASMSELVPKHARILVVEDNDNEFNWEVVKSFFMEDNHLLQWETNGLDAYQMYQEHHDSYDIVLMDCEMPIMNGYDSTRNIREFEKQHKLPRIPIIGVTAYAMSGDRKKCLDAGMDEFIVKPISKTELRKAIRKWMRVRFLGQHCPRPSRVESVESASTDSDALSNQNAANLVAASRHKEKLDLDRAISDLELEDPMMIGQPGGIQTVAGSEALLMSLTTISESKSNSTSSGTVGRTIGPVDVHRDSPELASDNQQSNGIPPHPGNLVNASSIVGTNLFAAAKAAGIYPMNATEPTPYSTPNSFSSSDGNNQQENATDATVVANKPARAYSSTMAPEDVVIPTGDPIDYSLGVEQCGANESLFVSLLEKYAGLSEEFMRRIEDAYSKDDFVVLRRESHSLKGSSAYVAAMRVSKAAFRVQLATEHVMEVTATEDDHTSLKDSFLLLKSEHRALRGYLRRNFSFRTSVGNGSQESKKKNNGGGDNACVVM